MADEATHPMAGADGQLAADQALGERLLELVTRRDWAEISAQRAGCGQLIGEQWRECRRLVLEHGTHRLVDALGIGGTAGHDLG